MRVLFCKIHCPFICFCKPSPHLYNPSPLKLENTPHTPPPPRTTPIPPATDANTVEEGKAHANGSGSSSDNGNGNCNGTVNHLKSSLRKPSPESSHVEKKKVQWVDVLGKELAEIREFESNEEDGDPGYGRVDNRGCVCTIL